MGALGAWQLHLSGVWWAGQVDAVPLLNFNDDSKLQKLAELKDAFDFQARGIEVVVSVSRVDKGRRGAGVK